MRTSTRGELMLLSATLAWGSTFALGKIVLEEVSPLQMVLIRFTAASVILLTLAWRRIFPMRARVAVKGSILGLFLFVGFITQTVGLTMTTASKSAFITGMMVIFVPLLQFMMERRPPKIGNVLGVLVVACGLWLLTSPSGSASIGGDALSLACAVVSGIYIVYLDIVSREVGTFPLMFLQTISNAGLALLCLLVTAGPLVPVVSAGGWGVLAYLTVVATVLTLFIQTRFQKDTTPVRAVVIFSIEPVIAAVIAYFMLGEELGSLGILGGALIIAGVLLSELSDGIPLLNRLVGGGATPENAP